MAFVVFGGRFVTSDHVPLEVIKFVDQKIFILKPAAIPLVQYWILRSNVFDPGIGITADILTPPNTSAPFGETTAIPGKRGGSDAPQRYGINISKKYPLTTKWLSGKSWA